MPRSEEGTMFTLTRNELDITECEVPDCTHEDHSTLYIHGRCHMNAGNEVSYNKLTGLLTIACKECKKRIAQIAVAYTN